MRKLLTLKPRLATLPDRIPTLEVPRANRTGRDADPRRTLPLNSSAWQRLRASVLSGDPLCRDCTRRGLTVAATDVDHRDGNPANNDLVNLQPLCHECHSRKTAAEHGKRVAWGCDANGIPLDPAHPWRQAVDSEKSPATEAGQTDRFTSL